MIYVSQLLGQKVWDAFGREIGRLGDILVDSTDKNLPPVVAVSLKNSALNIKFISAINIASLWPSVTLKTAQEKILAYHPNGHELHLNDRVMDQQIVDIEGKRLVRVNDIQLARSADRFLLTGVDVSGQGLLRRLGIEKIGESIGKAVGKPKETEVIPWRVIASIEHDDPLRLQVSQNKLRKMLPADIASIIDDLDHHTSNALLQGFDNQALADTLEESSSEMQVSILSNLSPERAADILEEMGPDEAADLLADLPQPTSETLLGLMEIDNAEEMRTLLSYPEDTAGGIMTTEFASVPNDLDVSSALEYLRNSQDAMEDEVMYYIHIVDPRGHLRGIVTLRDLVMADQQSSLDLWEDKEPITVSPFTKHEEVAYLIAKYDLLSIPVVDENTRVMLGIVTVDDAIDSVLPTAWKKRLPRFF
jgi:CBS domain-containing protein/sporulation protein YlmC with PRC-barrel domain